MSRPATTTASTEIGGLAVLDHDDVVIEDQIFTAVRALINHYDPEGLLEMGAPADEYASEAGDLTALVLGRAEITPEAVALIWNRWFDNGVSDWCTRRPEQLAKVASELERLRRESRRTDRECSAKGVTQRI